MALLDFTAYNPRFNSVENHVIDNHSVTQVNAFLDTDDAENLKLLLCQASKQLFNFVVLLSVGHSLIHGNNQLICLFKSQYSSCIHY